MDQGRKKKKGSNNHQTQNNPRKRRDHGKKPKSLTGSQKKTCFSCRGPAQDTWQDTGDKNWYCKTCWENFEGKKGGQAKGSRVVVDDALDSSSYSPTHVSSQNIFERKDNLVVLDHLEKVYGLLTRGSEKQVHMWCGETADRQFSSRAGNSGDRPKKGSYFDNVRQAFETLQNHLNSKFVHLHTAQLPEGNLYGDGKCHSLIDKKGVLEMDFFATIGQTNYGKTPLTPETLESGKYKHLHVLRRKHNDRESPDREEGTAVAIFEFKTNPDEALYALGQLEIRLAFWTAYQLQRDTVVDRHPQVTSSTTTAGGSSNQSTPDTPVPDVPHTAAKRLGIVCGLVVAKSKVEAVKSVLKEDCDREGRDRLFQNCHRYGCVVLPSMSEDHGQATSPGIWVSVTGVPECSDGTMINVAATLRKERLNMDIDGLKDAVLKKLVLNQHGKGPQHLTVYPRGEKKDGQSAITSMKAPLEIEDTTGAPYHVEVK